jgi:uncharacterized protein (DUF1800 family)
VLALAGALLAARADAADVVEFYNATLDNYFITADPIEAAAVDSGGAGPGWARTGDTFGAGGPTPVCRFYGSQSPGPNSHFYTAIAAECDSLKQLQATTPATQKRWNFESLDFSTTVPVNGTCASGTVPVYRAYNNGFARGVDSNHRITSNPDSIAAVVARGWKNEGVVMCAAFSAADFEADVTRLLDQATMGPTEALVKEVVAKGVAPWVDEQLALNVTRYTPRQVFFDSADPLACVNDTNPPITPEKFCQMNLKGGQSVGWEFFRQAKTAPDQLRMRVAYAWHLLFMTQWDGFAYGTADFQQRLRDHAFDTYENLLLTYTLAPTLGHFQNWVKNVPEHDGIRPNENYARELMQLFSIGVNALNDDGTPKLDANGRLIPNYTQADIETLARILTGFSYPTQPGRTPDFFGNGDYFLGDMIPFDAFHDGGAKNALGGRLVLPAGGTAATELRALIRVLVDHPSAPPFVSQQLIQKLVTSAPSPAYVARVVSVFKDNGKGVRGDLAAVVRAILLDPEARGPRKTEATYGRLREPALFWTAMLRALDVTTDGFIPSNYALNSGQNMFFPPTVFGYFPADFRLVGTTTPAPEFGLYGTTEYITRANTITDLLTVAGVNSFWLPQPFVANALGTLAPNLTPFLADAGNADVLVQRLNRLFLHGAMSPAMRKTVVNAVNKLPATETLRRTRMAVRLILSSIDWQVQK